MHIALSAPSIATLTSAVIPVGGTAGAVQTMFGDWFADLGAIGGGQPTAAHTLLLRFESDSDAVLAAAALSPVVDGVRLLVRNQNGSLPQGPAPAAGAVADFLARIHDVTKVEARTVPDHAFVVTSPVPDINAELDHILRARIAGLPVRWQTGPKG